MRLFAFLFVFLFFSLAFSQEATGPAVEEIVICTAIEDRQPVAPDTSFGADIGTLYCFTKITG